MIVSRRTPPFSPYAGNVPEQTSCSLSGREITRSRGQGCGLSSDECIQKSNSTILGITKARLFVLKNSFGNFPVQIFIIVIPDRFVKFLSCLHMRQRLHLRPGLANFRKHPLVCFSGNPKRGHRIYDHVNAPDFELLGGIIRGFPEFSHIGQQGYIDSCSEPFEIFFVFQRFRKKIASAPQLYSAWLFRSQPPSPLRS